MNGTLLIILRGLATWAFDAAAGPVRVRAMEKRLEHLDDEIDEIKQNVAYLRGRADTKQ